MARGSAGWRLVPRVYSDSSGLAALDPGAECDDTAPDEAPIRADPKEALAAWVDLQELLGDHQDAVVARAELRRIAAAARAAGEDTYSYGVLIGRETQRLVDNTARVEAALARALGDQGATAEEPGEEPTVEEPGVEEPGVGESGVEGAGVEGPGDGQ